MAAPSAERRLVTVLFADIVGFTPFAEQRDAEEVRETLSRYFELCAQIVERYGGTIEKYIGDAVMAVWGAPVAHEDDAERAVRAALDLVDSVTTIAPGIEARSGVLSGEAAVTVGATNQGLVAGDLVNTAARLQSVASPGSVLVGESTMRASSEAIAYEPAGEQELKGKQAPVAAWRATRVVAERGGRNRSEALEAPFVGRADELRLLKDLFHATGREEKARLVSVMGPAGIGKSRLAWEFLKYVDGLVETTYWHSGRSPAYGEGITFWALGEIIRGRCGLVEGDDEATTRHKVRETVAHWIADGAERAWIEPALLTLLGIDANVAAEELFSAWRTFFERISESGTVTLVFEDTHFADAGLLDFIDHLLEWSRGHPIYIVSLSRPELLDRREGWGAAKRSFTSLYLEPLSEPDMGDLLSGLVPGLAESAVAAIVGRADGIPLYAVETVRMLVSDGRLVVREGAYAPTGDLTSLAVPDTLTALIASRLDSLEPSDRLLVQDAAVLGQTFAAAGLAAVSGVPEADLTERLKVLTRREILMRGVDTRSAEHGQYTFVQALIREVAYNTLSKKDRKQRHVAAARYLEQLGSDELASALAGHYLAARHNAAEPAEADALAAQARVALRAAAERAVALGAHAQAVTFLEQAVQVTDDPVDKAELMIKAGRSDTVLPSHAKAAGFFTAALQVYQELGDRTGAAQATAGLAWDLLNDRKDQAAQDLLKVAITDFADLWPDETTIEMRLHLARSLSQGKGSHGAVEVADEALEAAERLNLVPLVARGLVSKGNALAGMGRLREGIALIRAGGDIARERDLNETLAIALVIEGFHLSEIDNSVSLDRYREGLALAKRTGQLALMLQFVNNLCYTGFLVGDWDEALAEVRAVLEQDLDISGRVWLTSNYDIIRAARGEQQDEDLAELDRLVEEHGDPHLVVPVLDTKANVAQAAGRTAQAREYWREAAQLWLSQAPASLYEAGRQAIWDGDLAALRLDMADLDATGFHGPVIDVRRATLAAAEAALEGRAAEAHALYKTALDGWRNLHIVWEEALTGIDMVTVLDPAEPDVQAAVVSTREILVRLGAAPYIVRLDAVASRADRVREREHSSEISGIPGQSGTAATRA